MHKKTWLFLIAVAGILPILPLFFGFFPAVGDMRDVFIPLESFFHIEQMQGRIPAWNSNISFGFPVIAAAQIGFFYPVLFILRILPIWLELPIAIILHTALLVLGTAIFSRTLGMSRYAASFTAISFGLSQFVWQHFTHLNIFLAIAWLPWQLLAVDFLFRKEKIEAKGVITLIFLLGFPFLIGQIQVPFLMMLIGLAYGIYIRGIKRGVVSILLWVIVGTIGLTSVQLFPTAELAQLSSRGGSGGFDIARANQHSYPLYHLPTVIFPRFYGNDDTYWGKRLEIEYGTYVGLAPLFLAIWYAIFIMRKHVVIPAPEPASPVGRPESRSTQIVHQARDGKIFFLVLGVISLLLALGSLSPFRVIGLEPSLWIFSAPARWLLFTTFSLSVFAGFGLDALEQHKHNFKRFARRLAIIIFVGVVIGNVAIFNTRLSHFIQEKLQLSERAGTKISSLIASAQTSSISLASPYTYLAIGSLIALLIALSHKHTKRTILIVTIVELALIAGTTTSLIHWKKILEVPTTVSQLPDAVQKNMARVYPMLDGGDTGAYFTDPESRADDHKRNIQREALIPLIASQFHVSGVSWPASIDLAEQEQYLGQLHPNKPFELEDTALAQELTIGAVLTTDKNGGIEITPTNSKPRIELLGSGDIQILSETHSDIVLQTSSATDATLIIRDTYYPGWRAYVDGSEVLIRKNPLFFRSIKVPAGSHLVTMHFAPKSLYIGGIITLLTIFICVMMKTIKHTL